VTKLANTKHVELKKETWKELMSIKIELGLKSIDAVIQTLLNERKKK